MNEEKFNVNAINAEDYTEEPNVIEVRKRIAAMDGDEIKAACQVLATLHTAAYIDALKDATTRLIRDYAEVEQTTARRIEYIKGVCGDE